MERRDYRATGQTVTATPKEMKQLERDKKHLYFEHKMMHLDGTDTYD